MSTLSSQPYKGTRDWYPDDMRLRNLIFDSWKQISQSYGYEQYDAPLIEPLEVYTAKSGQELANEQTYSFIDRGDRSVAIRPEMTPSVSRMVAARRQELGYPARLFSIAQFMRYERPQRGREREFWQLNVDIFGSDSVKAEAEIIIMGANYLNALGAQANMYAIKVNNRELINVMMHDYLQLDAIQAEMMIKLFDRKNKISNEEFRDQAVQIAGDKAHDTLHKISSLLTANHLEKLPETIRQHKAVQRLIELFDSLASAGVMNASFDITLMRGLDYYTGTVFEFYDTNPENNRSMFGGGRYDGLVGLFGAEPLSAVGIALGLSTTELFLRSHNLLTPPSSTTDVYVVVLPGGESTADDLASRLRHEMLNVEVDISQRKIDKQIKTALKKNIPYMVFIGPDEAESHNYKLKAVASSDEQTVSFERLVTILQRHRHTTIHDDIDDLIEARD